MRPLVIIIGLAAIALIDLVLAVFGHFVGLSWEDSFLAAGMAIAILIGTAFVAAYAYAFVSYLIDEREYRKGKYDR